MLKYISILVLLWECLSTNHCYSQPLNGFERSDETGRITISQVFNVYNRDESDILRYGHDFLYSLKPDEYNVFAVLKDTVKNCYKALWKFNFKVCRTCNIVDIDITGEIYIYAKQGRSKIEITNFTYEGETKMGKQGTLESIVDCGTCPVNYRLKEYLNENAGKLEKRYHEYLAKMSKSKTDW